MTRSAAKSRFFATPQEFRRWLEQNHDSANELVVGFYKKESGRPSITWPESVDQALCFGWIDGIRHSIDDVCYSIRFTPRKQRSRWSRVNIRRAQELIEAGLMQPAGLAAFQRRDPVKDTQHEVPDAEFPPEYVQILKANRDAYEFFQAQPPGYRKIVARYVLTAKKEETQRNRLQHVIDESAAGRRIGLLRRPDSGARKT